MVKIPEGEYSFKGRHLYINPLFLMDEGVDADPQNVFMCPRVNKVCRPVDKTKEGLIKCRLLERNNG